MTGCAANDMHFCHFAVWERLIFNLIIAVEQSDAADVFQRAKRIFFDRGQRFAVAGLSVGMTRSVSLQIPMPTSVQVPSPLLANSNPSDGLRSDATIEGACGLPVSPPEAVTEPTCGAGVPVGGVADVPQAASMPARHKGQHKYRCFFHPPCMKWGCDFAWIIAFVPVWRCSAWLAE